MADQNPSIQQVSQQRANGSAIVSLAGYVGRTQAGFLPDGRAVLSFSVGVSQFWSGDVRTDWYWCRVYGPRAEALAGILQPGQFVVVTGPLVLSPFIRRDGSPGATGMIRVWQLTLGPRRPAEAQPELVAVEQAATIAQPQEAASEELVAEELPF